MISNHTRKLLVLLVITIGVVIALNQTSIIVAPPSAGESNQSKPKTFIEGARILNFDGKGQSTIELTAQSAKQYDGDATIDIHAPRIFLRNEINHYELVSKDARYDPNAKEVELVGDVVLKNLNPPKRSTSINIELETEVLKVDLVELTMSTELPIEIQYGPHQIRSTGFSAQLESSDARKKSSIKFHSRVKGYYAISNPS